MFLQDFVYELNNYSYLRPVLRTYIMHIYMGFVSEINLFYFVVEAGEQTSGDLAATRRAHRHLDLHSWSP